MSTSLTDRARALVSHCMERREAFKLFADYPCMDVDDFADVFAKFGVEYGVTCDLYEDYEDEGS